jgi:hypothetical protein
MAPHISELVIGFVMIGYGPGSDFRFFAYMLSWVGRVLQLGNETSRSSMDELQRRLMQ